MSFPCTSCGACCRDVKIFDNYPALKGILAYKEDGSCVNLTEENLCAIYDTRPELCRIPQGLSRRMLLGTAHECNRLQEKYGIGEEYRVVVGETEGSPSPLALTADQEAEAFWAVFISKASKDQQQKGD